MASVKSTIYLSLMTCGLVEILDILSFVTCPFVLTGLNENMIMLLQMSSPLLKMRQMKSTIRPNKKIKQQL